MIDTKRLSKLFVSLFLGSALAQPLLSAELEGVATELDRIVTGTTLDEKGQAYRNAVVLLQAPKHSLAYTKGAGVADVQRETAMTADHQFYIESITKTFTATIVLQLAEEGRLGAKGLDVTLSELNIFPPDVLDQLHRIGDES